MSYISSNLRVLRAMKNLSQEGLSKEMEIPRSRLGSYEEGRAEPPYDLLISFADYFNISIDALLRGDLNKTHPHALLKVGKNRTLFPIQVDHNNNDLIEVVPIKASAGYTTGYSDPEFISELPTMNLPFKITGKHRAFAIKGDSMPPLKEGATIVGKFVETLDEVTDGQTYVILTKNDGVVYKRLYREKKKNNNKFTLHSDNPLYNPYTLSSEEILEMWSFVCSLNIGEFKPHDLNMENVIKFLQSYRVEMKK